MSHKVGLRILYFLNFYLCCVQDVSCTKHKVGEGISHHVTGRCSRGFFLLCTEVSRDQQLGYIGMPYSINSLKLHSEVVLRKWINMGEKHWYPWIKGNREEHTVIMKLLQKSSLWLWLNYCSEFPWWCDVEFTGVFVLYNWKWHCLY